MQLVHRKVPREFLDKLPEGIKFINRHGKEYLVVESLFCPNGHSLMSESVRIHDEPSIAIAVGGPFQGQSTDSGLIFIDAYWGSHSKLFTALPHYDFAEPVEARCPHCGVSLIVERSCGSYACDSERSILFHLPGEGNSVCVCAKLGCPDHRIVVGDVPNRITDEINQINFFGYGDDEAFGGI